VAEEKRGGSKGAYRGRHVLQGRSSSPDQGAHGEHAEARHDVVPGSTSVVMQGAASSAVAWDMQGGWRGPRSARAPGARPRRPRSRAAAPPPAADATAAPSEWPTRRTEYPGRCSRTSRRPGTLGLQEPLCRSGVPRSARNQPVLGPLPPPSPPPPPPRSSSPPPQRAPARCWPPAVSQGALVGAAAGADARGAGAEAGQQVLRGRCAAEGHDEEPPRGVKRRVEGWAQERGLEAHPGHTWRGKGHWPRVGRLLVHCGEYPCFWCWYTSFFHTCSRACANWRGQVRGDVSCEGGQARVLITRASPHLGFQLEDVAGAQPCDPRHAFHVPLPCPGPGSRGTPGRTPAHGGTRRIQ